MPEAETNLIASTPGLYRFSKELLRSLNVRSGRYFMSCIVISPMRLQCGHRTERRSLPSRVCTLTGNGFLQ